MLTTSKKNRLYASLKQYHKQFLSKKYIDLDESGTRLMINSFLSDVLGYTTIDEIKTEYMIRGTYADYVIQTKGVRHFLVEVKSLSIELSDKHLRQAKHYGADEGIDWALLTNGKNFEFYRILFNKPVETRKVFSIDLSDKKRLKDCVDTLQFLHKDSVTNKGLKDLWDKCVALDPQNVAGLLYAKPVLNFIKRTLRKKFRIKFTDGEISESLNRIVLESFQLDNIKAPRVRKKAKAKGTKTEKPSAENTPAPAPPPVLQGVNTEVSPN